MHGTSKESRSGKFFINLNEIYLFMTENILI